MSGKRWLRQKRVCAKFIGPIRFTVGTAEISPAPSGDGNESVSNSLRSRAYGVFDKNKYSFPNGKSARFEKIKRSIAVAGNTFRDLRYEFRPPCLHWCACDVRDFWRPSRSAQGAGATGIISGTKRRAKDATAWGLLGVHTHNNVYHIVVRRTTCPCMCKGVFGIFLGVFIVAPSISRTPLRTVVRPRVPCATPRQH